MTLRAAVIILVTLCVPLAWLSAQPTDQTRIPWGRS
jgi:hypothetical protein